MRTNPFILLCTTGLFAIFSSTISKSPVLPLFASHLGADPSGVGLIAAISAFTGVLFSVPAGIFSDRVGKKKMLLYSAFIFCSAPLLYPFITYIWQLALIRFYHGFATAIFIPVSMAMVSELFHKERGEKMGWFSTATLAGRFMAPIIGGCIIGALTFDPALGFKTVYIVCALAGAVTLLLSYYLPGSGATGNSEQTWPETLRSFISVLSGRTVLVTCAVEAAILFAYGTFETFLPLYAVSLGISPYRIGIFLSVQILTLATSKPFMGRFSDRHGRRPQIFFGSLAGAACIGCFSLFHNFALLLVLSAAFGMSLSVVTSATSAYIADLSSSKTRGSAMGLLGSIMDMGHTAGPLVSGLVVTYFGYPESFAVSSFVLVLLAFVFAFATDGGQDGATAETGAAGIS